ncbi:hypothetical protein AVEN_257100-1 [Araneus ventricosus]|uniref:Uncharacterized protein n=1 Tax=Araneus ventricosus TaxID=182803 RepID=A0A4Y2FRJ9_ARAVE|nr:hypothetical protein AVEN_257100-1 [Araneus ventricosus]
MVTSLHTNGMAALHTIPIFPLRWVFYGDSMQTTLPVTPIRKGYCDCSFPRFQNGSLFRERDSLPHGSPFCGFCLCERASLPFPKVAFQFYDPTLHLDNERSSISNLLTDLRQFPPEFRTSVWFWIYAAKFAWSGLTVTEGFMLVFEEIHNHKQFVLVSKI